MQLRHGLQVRARWPWGSESARACRPWWRCISSPWARWACGYSGQPSSADRHRGTGRWHSCCRGCSRSRSLESGVCAAAWRWTACRWCSFCWSCWMAWWRCFYNVSPWLCFIGAAGAAARCCHVGEHDGSVWHVHAKQGRVAVDHSTPLAAAAATTSSTIAARALGGGRWFGCSVGTSGALAGASAGDAAVYAATAYAATFLGLRFSPQRSYAEPERAGSRCPAAGTHDGEIKPLLRCPMPAPSSIALAVCAREVARMHAWPAVWRCGVHSGRGV
mmetsp:Transcript_57847/g.146851  ORF Transcript_57847/g.146851 Transcript_57847/m.146851 type:complete len:275 (-) Transcript_57847:30-854(-)